jgi:hypothetical protein
MTFSLSSFSFAYWASSIAPDNAIATADVAIGEWTPCTFIYTAQEFYDMATSSTSTYTDSYCLANDIDFSGFTWTYTNAHAGNWFKGLVDGKGHTISNISIEPISTVTSYISIFSKIDGATFKNLTVDNFSIAITSSYFNSRSFSAGVFAGSVDGNPVTFDNIRINNADVMCTVVTGCAGLTGQIEANTNVTFTNIKIRGLTVLSSSRRVGGLFSRLNPGTGTVIVEDVDIQANLAADESTTYTGGIAGTVRSANFYASRVIVDYIAQGSIDLLDATISYQSSRYTGGLIGNDNAGSNIVVNDAFYTGELYNTYNNAGAMQGRKLSTPTYTNAFYSNVYFVNTYTATTSSNVFHGTMVNQQSLPSVVWWNNFSTTFYSANNYWAQDASGRLYLID